MDVYLKHLYFEFLCQLAISNVDNYNHIFRGASFSNTVNKTRMFADRKFAAKFHRFRLNNFDWREKIERTWKENHDSRALKGGSLQSSQSSPVLHSPACNCHLHRSSWHVHLLGWSRTLCHLAYAIHSKIGLHERNPNTEVFFSNAGTPTDIK